MASKLTPLRIALDWTPNTIHLPLLVAKSMKYYEAAGLDVSFLLPSPEYEQSPARKLQKGDADLALCPSETVLAYNTSAHPMHLEAISTLMKSDASRIATIAAIMNPAELKGFRYGSYNARYEDAIVNAVVRNAALARTNINASPEEDEMEVLFMKDTGRLDMFEAMQKGEIEATWIFEPWEGVRARMEGFPVNLWQVGKFGVDYGYSPIIVRDKKRSPEEETLRRFLKATAKASEFARDEKNQEKVLEVLKTCCPEEAETAGDFLEGTLGAVRQYLGDGKMEERVWEKYVGWLRKEGLLGEYADTIEWKSLFTNKFHD